MAINNVQTFSDYCLEFFLTAARILQQWRKTVFCFSKPMQVCAAGVFIQSSGDGVHVCLMLQPVYDVTCKGRTRKWWKMFALSVADPETVKGGFYLRPE